MNITLRNFDSKEIYLQWRQEWRKEYAILSKEIHNDRCKCKDRQKAGDLDNARLFQFRLIGGRRAARQMMADLEFAKTMVRQRLRALGIPAPDPSVHFKPSPRVKCKWTPEQIAAARYCFEVRGADGHSD